MIRSTLLRTCVFASIAWTTHAGAADCAQYLNQVVIPGTLEDFLADLERLPNTKGEFETSAAYEARMAAALAGVAGPRIVGVPMNLQYVAYDADASVVTVKTYAVSNENTDYSRIFGYGSPYEGKVPYASSVGSNIHIVVRKPETTDGSFTGQNSYGATSNITRVKRQTLALFEREGARGEDLFFPTGAAATARDQVIAAYPNTPVDVAKKVKSSLTAAMVVTPKWPFYAKGKVFYGPPTMRRPIDIDETLEVGVVDFQCALLMNPEGKVFGAIDTR